MNKILELQNITKKYGDSTILNKVSLDIKQGIAFGLLGPNGAGKTTLIRIINQITAQDSGEITFNGKPFKREHIAQIGYLPEERGLYRSMKVGEQSLYLAQLKGLSRKEALDRLKYWFEKLEMNGWWNKKIDELSKGMAQKVQFISTVIHEPKLLILDEPFTGFDPINANIIKNEILELKKKNTTIIFSTHRMESIEELCDEIALINDGKCILKGELNEVKKQFKENLFEVKTKSQISKVDGFEILKNEDNTYLFKGDDSSAPNQLLQQIIPQAEIISFQELLPSINDIFISKIKE
jgi:ABC-2 type transport system ATP-binding protein